MNERRKPARAGSEKDAGGGRRRPGPPWGLPRRHLALFCVLLSALAVSPARAQEQDEPAAEAVRPGFEYVIYVSREPESRRRFECKRVAPDTGFITDPDIAPYFPYRLARGRDHYAVIEPLESMTLYWLDAEQRYARWMVGAAGSLAECEQLLVKIEIRAREQARFSRRAAEHTPQWRKALEEATLGYIERLQPDASLEKLDVPKLWGELSERRRLLLEGPAQPAQEPAEPSDRALPGGAEPGEPPDELAPEPPQEAQATREPPIEPAGEVDLPDVEWLIAEAAPNDNGTHVALRWPIMIETEPVEEKPADKPEEHEEPAPRKPNKLLSEAERDELRGLEERLKALRPAYTYATYIAEAKAKQEEFRQDIAQSRNDYLAKAAAFFTIVTAFKAEVGTQVGPLVGLEAQEVTPRSLAERMEGLEGMLDEAQRRARSAGATAGDFDDFDRLRYARQLARHYLEMEEKRVSLALIEQDLLWNLSEALKGAQLPEGDAPQAQAGEPDTEALRAALAAHLEAGSSLDADDSPEASAAWEGAGQALGQATGAWQAAKAAQMRARLTGLALQEPAEPHFRREMTRLDVLSAGAAERLKDIKRDHQGRPYFFAIGTAPEGQEPPEPLEWSNAAGAGPAVYDAAKTTNMLFALLFCGAVLFMIHHVRRHPDVFVRRIPGLEAVDEAIGRATEMGKPAVFVHGLTGVSDIAVLASVSILGRMARRIADYESDLLVVNNDPIVYSLSYEVVQEGYMEAGRPDAFKPDNIFMVASRQFPYVAAVAGIMSRRRPAANFFMGYFYAESLILAEAGAATGAIQIAGTDSFTQLPFFVTTCDYTLMGEELYAASAYLSREPRVLATLKAQDLGKLVLMAVLTLGILLGTVGWPILQTIFAAYEKGW